MSQERPEITEWLAERGHSPEAIKKILERLDQFDAKVNRDSVFDAIAAGQFDIEALIKDALGE